jgi:hypothetical protein
VTPSSPEPGSPEPPPTGGAPIVPDPFQGPTAPAPLRGPAGPAASPPSARRRPPILGLVLLAVGLGIAALLVVLLRRLDAPLLPPSSTTVTVVQPTPNVVVAIRDLARLESTTFHMERVVDLSDEQTHLFGLVAASDAILLVAVGDVVAGVDLEKLGESDVSADWTSRSAKVTLPAPEVFATRLDHDKTRVYRRKTDVLASRHEDLEERARREAVKGMEKAAIDAGILDRARAGTERAIRALLTALGFQKVTIDWRSAP